MTTRKAIPGELHVGIEGMFRRHVFPSKSAGRRSGASSCGIEPLLGSRDIREHSAKPALREHARSVALGV